MKTRILFGLTAVLLALQVIRPEKNLGNPRFTSPHDITVLYPPSPEVKALLENSCYDCHSNRTHYPWYAEVEPIGWWLASHIRDGKRELNFAEFGEYSQKRQMKKLEAICDEVRDKTMPLSSYTWIHRSAKLTTAQAEELCHWAEDIQDKIAAK